MKAVAAVLFSLLVTNSYATWNTIKCSNSDGTVNWESSSDLNSINLKYANFVEGTLTLDIDQVNIDFSKEITIFQKSLRSCTYASTKRVFAGKVKIKAADKNPDVLRGQFPENKVETEVICTHILSAERECAKEQG